MENNATQQEVLLITTTGFASRQFTLTDISGNAKNIPENEKLREACWNGLLKEILPELFVFNSDAVLFLWQVREASHF